MASSATTAWLAVVRALRMTYRSSSPQWNRPLRASNSLSQPSGVGAAANGCSTAAVDDATIAHSTKTDPASRCTVVSLTASEAMARNSSCDYRVRGDQSASGQTADSDVVCNAMAPELSTISYPLRNHPQERQSVPTLPANQLIGSAASLFRESSGPIIGNRTPAASRKIPSSHLVMYNLSTVPHSGAARIIDGRAMAEAIKRDVAADVALLRQGIVDPSTLENHLPDPAEREYRRSQHCGSLGIHVTATQKSSGNTNEGGNNQGDRLCTGSTTFPASQSQREGLGVGLSHMATAILSNTHTGSTSNNHHTSGSSSSSHGGNHTTTSGSSKSSNHETTDGSDPGSRIPPSHHSTHQPAATSSSTSNSSSIGSKSLDAVRCASTVPSLAVVLVGRREDSLSYVRMKEAACEETGIATITINLPESVSEERVVKVVRDLNEDHGTHGILVQLPLPEVRGPC